MIRIILFLTFLLSQSFGAFANSTTIPEVNLHHSKNKESQLSQTQKNDAKVQTTRFTREEIKNTPVTDLTNLLKQEQSIARLSNSSGDSSQTIVSIRGFGDNAAVNSLILIDGFPLINPSLLAPNLNAIILPDIERIDILQGSEGVIWGNQAIGGVINIITRHPEKLMTNVTAAGGSFNNQFYSLFAGEHFNHGIYLKGYGLLNRNHTYRAHNQQNNNGVFLQPGFDYARGTINLKIQSLHDESQLPGALTQQQYDDNPRQASEFVSFNDVDTTVYQLFHQHQLSDKWLIETRASQSKIQGSGIASLPYTRHENSNSINPQLIGYTRYGKSTAGYTWYTTYFTLYNNSSSKVTTQQNNFYAQQIIPVTKKVDFTLGTRYAMQDNQIHTPKKYATTAYHLLVTEIGIAYYLSNASQLFIRRAGNFRFPNATEQLMTPSNTPILDAQTGISYETGMTYTNDVSQTKLSVYQLQEHNELAYDPDKTPTQPFGAFRNLANTKRKGITIVVQYRLTDTFTVNTQLNYVDAVFSSGSHRGNLIPAVPTWNGNLGLDKAITETWHMQYSALYTGNAYASKNDANIGKKQPSYWINTIALQYLKKYINISFEIMNLFDQTYATYTIFNAKNVTNTYYPGTGRSYLLTAKIDIE